MTEYWGTGIDGPKHGELLAGNQPYLRWVLPSNVFIDPPTDKRMINIKMQVVTYAWFPDNHWRLTEDGQMIWVKWLMQQDTDRMEKL